MAEIEARVCGIPCIVEVLYYEPVRHGRFHGRPEDCYPDEGGESEWQLLDRRGRRAEWLERKMTDQDREKVEALIYEKLN